MIPPFFSKNEPIFIVVATVLGIKLLLFCWAQANFNFGSHPGGHWLNIWDRWDSGVYKAIATSAYSRTADMKMDWWAFLSHFPPLYPAIISVITFLGISIPASGILVSFFSAIIVSIMLYKLALVEFNNQRSAMLTVWFFNFFPTSYFSISLYSESLFILLAVSSFYHLRKENFLYAGLLSGGAILTRSVGIVFIPIYFLYVLYDYFKNRKINFNSLYLCVLPMFAVLIYMRINKVYYDDYFYFLNETLSFNTTKHLIFPFKESYSDLLALFQGAHLSDPNFMMTRGWNAVFVLLAMVVTILGIKRVKWEYTIFSMSSILLFSSLSWGISNARYVFSVFPIFMILGSMENRLLQGGILGVFFVGLLHFTKIFTSGAWAF